MNQFLELTRIAFASLEDHFDALMKKAQREFLSSKESFENFAYFLGKSQIQAEDVVAFLEDLRQYLLVDSEKDAEVSLVSYGAKILYVCCPHMEDCCSAASYFINGINTFPEHILEGSGLRYWGG